MTAKELIGGLAKAHICRHPRFRRDMMMDATQGMSLKEKLEFLDSYHFGEYQRLRTEITLLSPDKATYREMERQIKLEELRVQEIRNLLQMCMCPEPEDEPQIIERTTRMVESYEELGSHQHEMDRWESDTKDTLIPGEE